MIDIATKEPAPQLDACWEQFERFAKPRIGREPAWLNALRKAGISRFAETGFPTTRDEDWRFTNVAPLAKLPMAPAEAASTGHARACSKA